MAIIYKASNQHNGKSYIGYTQETLNRRKNQHFYNARWGSNKGKRLTHFHRALLANPDNFIWSVLYESKDHEHCLAVMEDHFITEYDTYKNGYNSMLGGFRGPVLEGSANGMFGRTHTDEVRAHLSKLAGDRYRGKSYEERFGAEKAAELRKQRSKSSRKYMSSVNTSGLNNAHADHTVYTFVHRNGETFSGKRQDWMSAHPDLHKVGVCGLLKGNLKTYKGWTVIR